MRVGIGSFASVQATEFWQAELRAGRCFQFGTNLGPTVGNNSHVQLKNPAASGKQVIAYTAIVSIGVAGLLFIRRHDADITTDAGAGANLLLGGAAGVAHVRSQDNAALLGTTIIVERLPANEARVPVGLWWAELSPGQGVLFVPVTANVECVATFWWREV